MYNAIDTNRAGVFVSKVCFRWGWCGSWHIIQLTKIIELDTEFYSDTTTSNISD